MYIFRRRECLYFRGGQFPALGNIRRNGGDMSVQAGAVLRHLPGSQVSGGQGATGHAYGGTLSQTPHVL